MREELTEVNLGIQISKDFAEAKINAFLETLNQEDFTTQIQGMEVTTVIFPFCKISFVNEDLHLGLTLDVSVNKKTFLKEIRGKLLIRTNLLVRYQMNDPQNLNVSTELIDYEILNKPSLEMGWLKIPVDSLVEKLIEAKKGDICSSIDQSIQEGLSTKTQLINFQNYIYPLLLELGIDDPVHFFVDLHKIEIKRPVENSDVIDFNVRLSGDLLVSDSVVNNVADTPLVYLKQDSTHNASSLIRFRSSLSNKTIQALIDLNLQGLELKVQSKKIKIEQFILSPDVEKWACQLECSGDFDFIAQFWLKPKIENEESKLSFEIVDLKLVKAQVVHKWLTILFKKQLIRKLEEQLVFQSNQLTEKLDKQIKAQVETNYPIALRLRSEYIKWKNLQWQNQNLLLDLEWFTSINGHIE